MIHCHYNRMHLIAFFFVTSLNNNNNNNKKVTFVSNKNQLACISESECKSHQLKESQSRSLHNQTANLEKNKENKKKKQLCGMLRRNILWFWIQFVVYFKRTITFF